MNLLKSIENLENKQIEYLYHLAKSRRSKKIYKNNNVGEK